MENVEDVNHMNFDIVFEKQHKPNRRNTMSRKMSKRIINDHDFA